MAVVRSYPLASLKLGRTVDYGQIMYIHSRFYYLEAVQGD